MEILQYKGFSMSKGFRVRHNNTSQGYQLGFCVCLLLSDLYLETKRTKVLLEEKASILQIYQKLDR